MIVSFVESRLINFILVIHYKIIIILHMNIYPMNIYLIIRNYISSR